MWDFSADRREIGIETAIGVLRFDADRGGQLTRFAVKDRKATRELLPNGQFLPGLALTLADGAVWRLADCRADVTLTREDADSAAFNAVSVMGDGALRVELQYEVFADGAVFCNFFLECAEGRPLRVRRVVLESSLDVSRTANARWNYISRYPWVKQDATTVHAFNQADRYLPLTRSAELTELLAAVSLDLGWDNTRFFSNRVEFVLEDWSPFGDADMMKHTRTFAGQREGRFTLSWDLCTGGNRTVPGGYIYRNRWGLLFAGSPHLCGHGDPARRNNAMGARICHCIYPYVRVRAEWPWATMPIKQVKAQPPMVYKGPPALERADEAAAVGANLMIIHQFWMANPGSNNEPPGDYQPEDPKWLEAFVDRCHQVGMRVLLYARATEMWHHFSPFFERFCKRNYDGLYLDWSTPFAYGYVKGSMVHTSAYAFYTFHRAIRQRVGEDGIVIGHTGVHTQLAANLYDAALAGEFSVLHEVLLGEPEACAGYGIHGGCGSNLLGGGVKDRALYMSERAVAFCAAMGMSSHVIMSPDVPFDADSAYIRPLWDARRALPGSPVTVFNPTEQPLDAITCDNDALFPIVYVNGQGQGLVIVTNLGGRAADGRVDLDFDELGIHDGAAIKPLAIDRTHGCGAEGPTLIIENMPSERFCTALIA